MSFKVKGQLFPPKCQSLPLPLCTVLATLIRAVLCFQQKTLVDRQEVWKNCLQPTKSFSVVSRKIIHGSKTTFDRETERGPRRIYCISCACAFVFLLICYLHFDRDILGTSLKGCIEMIQLDSTERDIVVDNIDTKGVTPGCPEVSFWKSQ